MLKQFALKVTTKVFLYFYPEVTIFSLKNTKMCSTTMCHSFWGEESMCVCGI